jgi:hypothetical protein
MVDLMDDLMASVMADLKAVSTVA